MSADMNTAGVDTADNDDHQYNTPDLRGWLKKQSYSLLAKIRVELGIADNAIFQMQ